MKRLWSSSGSLRMLLGGNVLWLSLISLLNDTASEMIFPLLPLFLVGTLGASTTLLGLIEGVAESASSLLKLVSGRVSDRMRRRKPLILTGYGIATLARPLIAIVTAPWHVLAIRFSDRIGKGLRSAPRDALLAASVPASHRGRAFGIHRAADHSGAVIGPLIASLLLLALSGNLRIVFALAAIPGLIALLVIVLKVHEESRPEDTSDVIVATSSLQATSPEQAMSSEPAASPAATPFQQASSSGHPTSPHTGSHAGDAAAPLNHFFLALFFFTLGNASDAFLLLRAQDLGVPVALIPMLWSVHHVSKVAWSVPGGAFADRMGARPAIITGWLLYTIIYAAFALATSAWHAWGLFLLYGLFYGLTESPEKALVARLARQEARGSAFGTYHFIIGIAALPASLMFGYLWQHYSPATAFVAGAGLSLFAVLIFIVSPDPPLAAE